MDDRLTEVEYLEKAIGPTGLLVPPPGRHMSDRELWQINAWRGDDRSSRGRTAPTVT